MGGMMILPAAAKTKEKQRRHVWSASDFPRPLPVAAHAPASPLTKYS